MPGRQALLVLAHLRRSAAGSRIELATFYRYVRETVDLLAHLAPTLRYAVEVGG